MTLEELAAEAPPEPEWIWKGYVARGAVTLIAGKPKAGKSSIGYGLFRAMLAGDAAYLGQPIAPTPIVYVSEEGMTTLQQGRLPASGPMTILTRENAWPKPPWSALMDQAIAQCKATAAGLLGIDTLRAWAGFAAEGEKDASAMQKIMGYVDAATREGVGVVLFHHHRKADGDNGDAIAGSNALVGAADAVLEVERVEGSPLMRTISRLSRWTVPSDVMLIQRHEDDLDYDVLGTYETKEDAFQARTEKAVYAYVKANPDATASDVRDAVAGKAETAARCLAKLVAQDEIERTGSGKKGDPFLHRVVEPHDGPEI